MSLDLEGFQNLPGLKNNHKKMKPEGFQNLPGLKINNYKKNETSH